MSEKITVWKSRDGKTSVVWDFTHESPEPEVLAMVRERNRKAQEHALDRWMVKPKKEKQS